ncbi:MAG: single-stranded-DNA-specific exonuclease RecJ [Kiritimatiellae bacterium]|nr:single-stranded-DNA-specific exonuclease RecJ [Kiritimatiellia bacterium]
MKRWKTIEIDEHAVSDLADRLKIPHPIAAAYVSRGYTEDIRSFLQPRLSELSDPFLLPDMLTAVECIWHAIDTHQTIIVYGDYDVDGITSTALLINVLQQLGASVNYFLPHRVDDGYGLRIDTLKRCVEQLNPQLIITVDCGTNSIEAVEHAKTLNIDVIITDHHEPDQEVAKALALVNPKLGTCEETKMLAGVGVAFKLCHALLKQARIQDRPQAHEIDLRNHLDLVATGTITDIVPLVGENRILVKHGLERLTQTTSVGFKELIEVAGISGEIDTYHVGFMLGPRLNAAGRLGTAEVSLALLLTDDADKALSLAKQLDATNRERKETELKTFEEAMNDVEMCFDPDTQYCLVSVGENWHPGVIGIVASRICQRFNRPSIVIAMDSTGIGKGSCRSISAFNMAAGLGACAEHLKTFGGHSMAAGLEITTEHVASFKQQINQVAADTLRSKDLRPVQRIDAWIDLSEVNDSLLTALNTFRPFGQGNSRPIWATRRVNMMGQPRVVGKNHLKMTVVSGGTEIDTIGFGLGEREIPDGPIDIAFYPQINLFQGRDRLQLNLQDFRPATE